MRTATRPDVPTATAVSLFLFEWRRLEPSALPAAAVRLREAA